MTAAKLPRKSRTDAKKAEPALANFNWMGADYPRIKPGVYFVTGRAWQGPEKLIAFGRWSIRIEFALPNDKGTVSLFLNLGRQDKPHFGISSHYSVWWMSANGGPPARGQAMNPDVFLRGQIFEVVVDDARLDAKKKVKPDAQIYSRVTKLLSVTVNHDKGKAGNRPITKSPNHQIKQSPNQAITQSPNQLINTKNQESANQAPPNQESPNQGRHNSNDTTPNQKPDDKNNDKNNPFSASPLPGEGHAHSPNAHLKGGDFGLRSGKQSWVQ